MVKSSDLKSNATSAVLSGCALGGAWYGLAHTIFSGTAEAIVPAFGAIAIASTVPTFILNRAAHRRFHDTRFSMAQRLDAFDKHACINIVNENDELTEVNEKLLELTGYDRVDLIGQPVTILYEASGSKIALEIRNNLRSGKSWEGETALRHKNGHTVYTQSTIMPLFDRSGNWGGSISVRTDISRTNELISERHTAQTLYELRDDVWIIDSETETFSYMNRIAESRFNINSDDYRKTSFSELAHQRDTSEVLAACRELKVSGKPSTRFETVLMDIPVDVSIKFLPGTDETGRYLILINDISERVAQEKHKSAFISTVSHELRSPLTSIKGAMGLLLSKSAGELPVKAVSLLEIAHRNADRLVLIINDILDLDKISSGEMDFELKDVDLAALVKEVNEANAMLQQRFGVQVEIMGLDVALPFRTDPNRFIQVLTNLLSNAYKFSKPNSTIFIDVADEGAQVRVSVKDEGQGIPAEDQHKLFNRFSDMANSDRALKGGTGLGLNICKAIVENMGGSIEFESTEGIGTTFYFCLPKVALQDAQPALEKQKRQA
ncbi:PAS domain-containing sensor histidine kinase [Sulfitobacter guttiformis]|uniref:histidine kinase n=1 Tax=Sulfitobacter guttiformis TaxID=74349 RepID=A0A420DTQ6_9RHOB|nr:PAS domain-containing sensor histidine kinase [Sulfitobacter guttiformis]KIN71077.1 Multi-sensor hybrid histidine kinase [Sulfitobacter guttiformis KCTC 32187]RKE97560.1 PAS/PAC sensor signal transduction histidine kinase [Sulfitobacter guttiformis]